MEDSLREAAKKCSAIKRGERGGGVVKASHSKEIFVWVISRGEGALWLPLGIKEQEESLKSDCLPRTFYVFIISKRSLKFM